MIAERYRAVLLRVLPADPKRAASVFATFHARLRPAEREQAFRRADESALAEILEGGDVDGLTIVYEITVAIPLPGIRDRAVDALLPQLARGDDVYRLIGFLNRLQRHQLLTRELLTETVDLVLAHSAFDRESAAWSAFWDTVPDREVPESFDLAAFRGRAAEAAALAGTQAQRVAALHLCSTSTRIEDLDAGVTLAAQVGDQEALRALRDRLASALLEAQRPDDALPHLVAVGRSRDVTQIDEARRHWEDALRACPPDDHELRQRVVAGALRHVDQLVTENRFNDAGAVAAAAVATTAEGTDVRALAETSLAGVRAVARAHLGNRLAAAGPDAQAAVLAEWSEFEERAGDLAEAARMAARAGDRYRAHRLFRDAGRYGDAVTVLGDESTTEGVLARANALAEGGDARGSAAAFRTAGDLTQAAQQFERAGDPEAAARCWRDQLGADYCAESVDYVRCAIAANRWSELVDACVTAIQRRGRDSPALDHLRQLLRTRESVLPPSVADRARHTLGVATAEARAQFDTSLPRLLARAREDIDARFSDIWALDLGTTTCVAAIYDRVVGHPVACPWRGSDRFPSTVAIDARGEEVVALNRDEELAAGLVGVMRRSKRLMGSRRAFGIRGRRYRAEEVAARLIRHARRLVEDHLAVQVRERVAELARQEHGIEIPDEWLDHASVPQSSFRLTRNRVIVTVPAFFHNNQKNATRDAGVIAGTEVVRLVHEPTAACVAVHRQRPLTEDVIVADLGAGTLDLSWVSVGEGVYEVNEVDGDTDLGGADIDDLVARRLEEQLTATGVQVSASGRRRLEIAAERLKIRLSAEQQAEEVLAGFAGGEPVTLTLTRAELEGLLAEPLERLSAVCSRFRQRLAVPPTALTLVLVGGPFLSPVVRSAAERALKLTSVGVSDPGLVVAHGAALLGASRAGDLRDLLLLDITPLRLGIRVVGDEKDGAFSELIAGSTTIPTTKEDEFTTKSDNQQEVHIEVFQGTLTDEAKIAQFTLDGIPPAPKGIPRITVRFDIDVDCVLTVTARDSATGRSKSVSLADTTLLRPQERSRMTEMFEARHQREDRRTRIRANLDSLKVDLADTGALLLEWQSRRANYRPGVPDPDPAVAEALGEMYRSGTDVETELFHLELSLRDLADQARELVDKPIDDETNDREVHLDEELERGVARQGELRSALTRWNRALVSSSVPDADPLVTIVRRHDADDVRGAVEAWRHLRSAEVPVELVRRLLDCYARLGDRGRYEIELDRHSPLLGVLPTPAEDHGTFLRAVQRSVVRVVVDRETVAAGFVWSSTLLVVAAGTDDTGFQAAQVWLGDTTPVAFDASMVRSRGYTMVIPVPSGLDTPRRRPGYPGLLAVGEHLVLVSLSADRPELVPVVVQGIAPGPGTSDPEVSVSLARAAAAGVSPVFTARGEVVGVLTLTGVETQDTLLPLTSWAELVPLLVASGHDPWGD